MPKPDEFLTFEICVQVFVSSVNIYCPISFTHSHSKHIWSVASYMNLHLTSIPYRLLQYALMVLELSMHIISQLQSSVRAISLPRSLPLSLFASDLPSHLSKPCQRLSVPRQPSRCSLYSLCSHVIQLYKLNKYTQYMILSHKLNKSLMNAKIKHW